MLLRTSLGIILVLVGVLGGIAIAGQIGNQNYMMSTMMTMMNDDPNSKSIHMGMNNFMPNDIRIELNTTVTWQTHDMEIHNVSGVFKTDSGKNITILSGDIANMEKWSYTFEESGIFEYVCGYHENEGMEGKLVVSKF